MDPKEASFLTAVLIACGFIFLILGYFIISFVRQHRKSLRLYRQMVLTEINTMEKERSRIAADLHDEIGPVLSSIKLRMGNIEVEDAEDAEDLDKASRQIDELLKRLREISYDLIPASLIRKGFVTALREYSEIVNRAGKLQIEIQSEKLDLTENESIHLFRISQEIIHNTIKHADAAHLQINISVSKEMLILKTVDDGKGFDKDVQNKESAGLGLRSLYNRTEMLGGKMFIESDKLKGTTFIFEIPIERNEGS